MSNEKFIESVGAIARKDMIETGILASVTIAQAILESAYGTSDLAVNACNFFGMKCSLSGNTWSSAWDGESKYNKKTAEQKKDGTVYYIFADFRKYPDMETSVRDHSLYLLQAKKQANLRYEGLKGEKDYKKAVQIIKDGGYATDVKYVEKICNIIEKYDLTKYDKEVENVVRIAIDAGHGLKTAGKHCLKKLDPNQTKEWALNSRIADKLVMLLKGYNCEIIRTDDTTGATDVTLNNRVKKANAWGADVLISIHHNAGIYGGSGGGTVVYYYDKKLANQAKDLYNAVIKETGLVGNRWDKTKQKSFYVIKNATMPAFLLENGFMDSKIDVPIILSEAHATKTARALRDFLVNMFGLEKEPEEINFKVKITTDELNYRSGPGTDYAIRGTVKKGEVFTIVDTSGSWGKLKSGAGWINISQKYVTRL